MAITLSDERNVACPHCQAALLVVMWLAIDLVERADLRETLANGSTYVHACTACKRVFPRQMALVVTRMDDAAPVVMGCSKEALLASDPERGAANLLDHVYEQVRGGDAVIPWPMLYIAFPVLKVAVERDIRRDADHADVALADIARDSPALAKLYAIFLDDVDASSVVRGLNVGIERLHRVTSESELREVVAAFPGLLSVEAHELLEKLAESLTREEERRVVHAELALLRAYRDGDTAGAWARYEEAFLATMDITFNPELQRRLDIFKEALDGDPEQMITAGEELIAYARHVRHREIEAVACLRTAVALLETHDANRAIRIERAIQLLERANGLLDRHRDIGDEDVRRQTLAHLAAALGTRLRFDPAGNQERAIAIQRRLLEQVTIDADGDLWAKTHTHLANHLLARARALSDRDGPVAELPEILDHLSEALRWRSYERDPLDWAYTEVALGHAYAEGSGDLAAAVAHYDSAIRGFEAAGEPVLRAQAIGRRASVRIDLARADNTPDQRRAELLEAAETDARAELDMLETHSRGVEHGSAWWQLARVLATKDASSQDAADAVGRALEHWRPDSAPRQCQMAARTLAMLASCRGDTELAADAWATAAEAAAATVELHATREGRLVAIREYGDTFHSAAYSLAAAGRLASAVEILELGRARELATWLERDLVDIDQLRHADPELCERFLGLRQQIDALQHRGAEAADVEMATAVEALAATVLDIRRLPGLSAFLRRPHLSDLVAAPAGDAVAYPVVTPTGSCWLVLRARAEEPVTCIGLPDVTSARVRALFLHRDPSRSDMTGYLPAHRRTPVLDAAITEVGAVLGPELLKPLHEHLLGDGADEVCLVALGLLGLLPLHALTWSETDGATRCLLDDLVVAYAPSGYARFTCRRRAQERIASRKLVAVGNPLPHGKPLPHSEREARMVADSVLASETVLLIREEATKQAVVDALPGATHVHLACHGSAALTPQALDAALSLADHERLSAAEILAIEVGAARLVVASACQSGVIADLRAADEALALSHVFIAAGAAGVIASLWSVSDYATALLMTCFYERLADAPREPARALRAAELWLRDLRCEDERAYLARHPDLREHQAEHDAARSARSTLPPGQDDRRFSAPTLWAGFVFSGA